MPVVAVVAGLQVSAIVNYIDAYRQSNSYQRYNEKKIPLFTVKFFYFSLVMTLIFVIFFIIFMVYGVLILPLIILLPFIIILQVSGIVDYVDAYKNKDTHKDKE
ncbi:MAG: hypothetical protein K2J32_10475 [Ruminococcus sp.]|nr:hypothetical protein [Ruminococcus sp.]